MFNQFRRQTRTFLSFFEVLLLNFFITSDPRTIEVANIFCSNNLIPICLVKIFTRNERRIFMHNTKPRIISPLLLATIFTVFILLSFSHRAQAETVTSRHPMAEPIAHHTASPWFASPHPQQYMPGEWGGLREKLSDSGITFKATFVCDVLSNPYGGREQGIRYDHSMGLDINVDLEKAAGWKGLQFRVSGLYREGQNLSADKIDNTFTVTSIYGSEQLRFYGLYLDQALMDDRLHIRFGRISTGDDFISSPIY